MRIVLFTTNDHYFANYIIKRLLSKFKKSVVAIVESDVLYHDKTRLEGLKIYNRISGARYVIPQLFKVLFVKTVFLVNPNYCYKKKAGLMGITIVKTSNINDQQFRATIKKYQPTLFISIYFNQLFKKPILQLPKKGTINIHPALLPKYRGVSPTFWVIANDEKFTGVTVHRINSEKIDDGAILGQKKILINNSESEHHLYSRLTKQGTTLLIKIIKKISGGQQLTPVKKKRVGSYFSLPTKAAVARFQKNNRQFYTIRELFKLM